MHVLLYEWITGGGLVEQASPLPASLLAEGSAMIAALAADFAAIAGCRVSVLRDARLHSPPLAGCEVLEIHSATDLRDEIERLANAADFSLVIAPEFDGILRQTVQWVRDAGGRALNADDEFIRLTSDKQRTAVVLQAAGVPVPEGRILAADEEKLPRDFQYPAVLKPVDGAGSQHTLLVDAASDEPPPYPFPRRLERFVPGRPASVAALCSDAGATTLPACWQHLSADGRFSYHGGSLITDESLNVRARDLAVSALRALPAARGYVGVDLVLGDDPRGDGDVVIEVNPRLTTSYVGLRAGIQQNMASAMIAIVEGNPVELTPLGAPVQFLAGGEAWLHDRTSLAGRPA
jgi:predicted ATP-grasp superfamily ATP-dependent carboligase